MIPVWKQAEGRGIGLSVEQFSQTITDLPAGKKLAVIFRNGTDDTIRQLFKQQDIFAKLDRLAGPELDIFYADMAEVAGRQNFNREALSALNIEPVRFPAIVLASSLGKVGFDNVEIASIGNGSFAIEFQEIFEIIRSYKEDNKAVSSSWTLGWVGEIARNAFAAFLGNVAAG